MCKLRRIMIRRSLHIDKNQKIKFHSYNEGVVGTMKLV